MKSNSKHSDQRVFREELLSFIQEKASAFSFLYKSAKADMGISKMAIKLRRAYSQGQLCKKKCYDFVYALGGMSATKSSHAFKGVLHCDQEQIQGLINTSQDIRLNANGIQLTAERVLNALNNSVKIVRASARTLARISNEIIV